MNSKKMLMLIAAAVVLVGLAHWSSRRRDSGRAVARRIGTPVLPAFQDVDTVNRIARMTFVSPGSTVEVARVDGTWVAPGQYGYPVKFENVREFALSLVNLKIGHVLSASEVRRKRLGLLPPADERADRASSGTQVVLADEHGVTLAELIVGNEFQGPEDLESPMAGYGGMPQGRYVATDEEMIVVSELFHGLPRKAQDWLDDDLVHVAGSDIAKIELAHPERDRLVLRRPETGGNLTLSDLGAQEEMNTSKLGGLSGVLSHLRFADVADPALADEAMGLDRPVVLTAETRDGTRYRLDVGNKAGDTDDRYVRLSADWIETESPGSVQDETSDKTPADEVDVADAEDDEAEKDRQEREKKRAELEALNAQWSAWTYILPSYKIHHVMAAREDLVQEKKAKAKSEAGEPDKTVPDDGDSEKKPGFFRRMFGRD